MYLVADCFQSTAIDKEINCFPNVVIDKKQILEASKKIINGSLYYLKKSCECLVSLVQKTLRVFLMALAEFIGMMLISPIRMFAPPVNSVFSQKFLRIIHTNFTIPTLRFREFLTQILPVCRINFTHGFGKSVNFSEVLAVGISEELAFRGLIQSAILRKIPQMVLKKINPDYAECVDAKIARIARVIFTSALFALAHANGMGHLPGFLLPQLIVGLVWGVLLEYGTSIADLSLMHFFYDAIILTLVGGMPPH